MWLYRGKLQRRAQLPEFVAKLNEQVQVDLNQELPIRTILQALYQLGKRLVEDPLFFTEALTRQGLAEEQIQETIQEAVGILNQEALMKKIQRELGGIPGEIEHINEEQKILEGWLPVGVLGHVTSSNDPLIGFLSLVEGLITGNINLVKTSVDNYEIPLLLCQALLEIEPLLASRIYLFPIPSAEQTLLGKIFACCDKIAVWGSEKAVSGVKDLAPVGVEVVSWGHRISFAYFTPAGKNTEAMKALAKEVCLNEQQACSAPQVVYFETADRKELMAFAKELAAIFEGFSPNYPQGKLSIAEQAELTTQVEVAKLAEIMGDQNVLEGANYRLFVKFDASLEASPLYRTLIVKPINRQDIISNLRGFRHYLQTVGLSCGQSEIAEISSKLYAAGVTKITNPGQMLMGYTGEPHDGGYALAHYVKKVSLSNQSLPKGLALLAEMKPPQPMNVNTPVLHKEAFGKQESPTANGQLIIKSGGSSGQSVYAYHTYPDAAETYRSTAHAMISAGMRADDRVMNLFYGGELYGGFISMYEAVTRVGATQLPIQAAPDLQFVAKEIKAHKVNVLIGMPTYLIKLFTEAGEQLKATKLEKAFYGGEQFEPALQQQLEKEFGITIHSLTYGCNEIGTIGYVCEYCKNGEHHLHPTKYLEILALDQDEPVPMGETGRIVLTPVNGEATRIKRYELGDLGRFVVEPCPCGRQTPKFELQGRFGDSFKFATNLVSYQKFQQILAEHYDYHDFLQLVIDYYHDKERLLIVAEEYFPDLEATLKREYPEIKETLQYQLGIVTQQLQEYQISSSGKMRRVVDLRVASTLSGTKTC